MSRESDAPPGPDPLLGRVLADRLAVEALLGEGAMGRVYRARHLALDKTVAIKVLHRELNADKSIVGRFKAEARGASRLTHPNSVQILDFGVDGSDGLLYIAMEYLEGEDMAKLLAREERFTPVRAANLMVQILGALADAHDQGVIHRDMKPGNVVVTRRRGDDGADVELVKVCDFGLAKLLDRDAESSTSGPLTKAGQVFGTPAFMSPEQARGEVLDARTDLYSCGCILYRMLAGDSPFRAESIVGVLMKQISEEPTPLERLAPEAPPGLVDVVKKAMKKNRDERYASAREMRQDLVALFGAELSQPYIPVTRGPSAVAALAAPELQLEATAPSLDRVPGVGPNASQASIAPGPTPTARREWWVMLPGLLALVLLGGVAAFVLARSDRGAAPGAPAAVPELRAGPAAPGAEPSPPSLAPAVDAPSAAEGPKLAEGSPEPAVPTPPPPPAQAPSRRPAARAPKPAAPAPTPEVRSTPPPPIEPPAVVAPSPSAAAPVKERAAALEAELVRKAEEKDAERPKPAGSPSPRSSPAEAVLVQLADLKVGGGMSKGRVQQALSRYLPQLERCFADRAAAFERGSKGDVRIVASIELSGRLKPVDAKNGPAAVRGCVEETLRAAVMPKPDTGGAKLELVLRYVAR